MTHNLPDPLTYTGHNCSVLVQKGGIWWRIHYKRVAGPFTDYKWEFEHEERATLCSKCHTQPAVLIGLCDGCFGDNCLILSMTNEEKQAKIAKLKAFIDWFPKKPIVPDTQAERIRRINVMANSYRRLDELEKL